MAAAVAPSTDLCHTVSLSNKTVDSHGATEISEKLTTNPVHSLSLHDCSISTDNLQCILSAISDCPWLVHLSLTYCGLNDIESAKLVAEALRNARSIVSVELCGNRIGQEGLQTIVDAVLSQPFITKELNLSDCSLDDGSLMAVTRLLLNEKGCLRELDLSSNNGISTVAWEKLTFAIAASIGLHTVRLNRNSIGDTAGKMLALGAALNKNLSVVSLDDSGLSRAVTELFMYASSQFSSKLRFTLVSGIKERQIHRTAIKTLGSAAAGDDDATISESSQGSQTSLDSCRSPVSSGHSLPTAAIGEGRAADAGAAGLVQPPPAPHQAPPATSLPIHVVKSNEHIGRTQAPEAYRPTGYGLPTATDRREMHSPMPPPRLKLVSLTAASTTVTTTQPRHWPASLRAAVAAFSGGAAENSHDHEAPRSFLYDLVPALASFSCSELLASAGATGLFHHSSPPPAPTLSSTGRGTSTVCASGHKPTFATAPVQDNPLTGSCVDGPMSRSLSPPDSRPVSKNDGMPEQNNATSPTAVRGPEADRQERVHRLLGVAPDAGHAGADTQFTDSATSSSFDAPPAGLATSTSGGLSAAARMSPAAAAAFIPYREEVRSVRSVISRVVDDKAAREFASKVLDDLLGTYSARSIEGIGCRRISTTATPASTACFLPSCHARPHIEMAFSRTRRTGLQWAGDDDPASVEPIARCGPCHCRPSASGLRRIRRKAAVSPPPYSSDDCLSTTADGYGDALGAESTENDHRGSHQRRVASHNGSRRAPTECESLDTIADVELTCSDASWTRRFREPEALWQAQKVGKEMPSQHSPTNLLRNDGCDSSADATTECHANDTVREKEEEQTMPEWSETARSQVPLCNAWDTRWYCWSRHF